MKRTLFVKHAVGKAAEYRVASELLLRGITPSFPAVDMGCDIILEHGIRIQVKCCQARRTRGHSKQACYFIAPSKRIRHKNQRVVDFHDRVMSDECDFVIAWGIEENRFWIIPAHLLDGKRDVSLGPECYFKTTDLKRIIDLRQQGRSYTQIAKELDVSQTMVWALATGKRDGSDRYPELREIRACENRWDLLTQHIADLQVQPQPEREEVPVLQTSNPS